MVEEGAEGGEEAVAAEEEADTMTAIGRKKKVEK